MRRMVWFALGAAVGIYAYRRGQRFVDESRERGIVMTVQQAAVSASQAVGSARSLVEHRLGRAQLAHAAHDANPAHDVPGSRLAHDSRAPHGEGR